MITFKNLREVKDHDPQLAAVLKHVWTVDDQPLNEDADFEDAVGGSVTIIEYSEELHRVMTTNGSVSPSVSPSVSTTVNESHGYAHKGYMDVCEWLPGVDYVEALLCTSWEGGDVYLIRGDVVRGSYNMLSIIQNTADQWGR